MFASPRRVCVALFLAILFAVTSQAQDLDPAQGQMVLRLLASISVEYPQFVKSGKVVNADEYAEQIEFSVQVADAVRNFPPHPEKDALAASAADLATLIVDKGDSAKVSQGARNLQRGLIKAFRIQIAPVRAPDLGNAAPGKRRDCTRPLCDRER